MVEQLRTDLIEDEGLRLEIYDCTSGKMSIGIGRNLEDNGITLDEAEYLMDNNADRRKRILGKYDIDSTNNLKFVEIILRDIEKYGITKEEAFYLFNNDVATVLKDIKRRLPWVMEKSENVQRVIANMIFNMGINRLLEFEDFLGFLKLDEYELASDEMLDSIWAKKQCKKRAFKLSNIIRNEKI